MGDGGSLNDGLTFNDESIERFATIRKISKLYSVCFDYSPTIGRITRVDFLAKFSLLSELSLIGHQLESLIALENLVHLTRLNLSWNSVTSLLSIVTLKRLEYLNLSHNFIEELPVSISGLTRLTVLHLGFNPIADRGQLFHLIQNVNLSNLDLEGSILLCESEAILFVVQLLPHLTIFNRAPVTPSLRKAARKRFCGNEFSRKHRKLKSATEESYRQENIKLHECCESQTKTIEELKNHLLTIREENEDLKTKSQIAALRIMESRIPSLQKEIDDLLEESSELRAALETQRQKTFEAEQMVLKLKKKCAKQTKALAVNTTELKTQNFPPEPEVRVDDQALTEKTKLVSREVQQLREMITTLQSKHNNELSEASEQTKKLQNDVRDRKSTRLNSSHS
jgi:hypothetical protein